jgi:integrase
LKAIFASARRRGRFPKTEDNPFDAQRREFSRTKGDRYTDQEAVTLINAFGPHQVKPAKHTVETALPWAVLISAHSGLGLEEVTQLTVTDIKTVGGNGSSVVCFDIHNGDDGHHLKNDETRPRQIPVHSVLARAGLLDYVAALPKDGLLFPGLRRRGEKIGRRLGELFNDKRRELGITREDKKISFHSWRHTVASKMDKAGIPESHMNAVLGHAQATETTRTYSDGPGIHNLKVAVEAISYEGLKLPKK